MTEEGQPLGIVDQVIWTRDKINTDLTKQEKDRLRKQTAFEEKESHRWLDMFQSSEQIARANPGTNYTVVGDSESDICEIFAEVGDCAENCHFVIRGCQNRAVTNCGDAANVDEALEAADIQFTSRVNISERVSKIAGETRPRRKSRSARMAEIGVRAREITIRGPVRPGGKLPNITLNVVEAVELDPPEGDEPIRWVLFTTLSINSIVEIQRVISTYSTRWNIELYFKTLKSGLKIEKLKYETLDRYLTALSMLMIVGWRVEYLKGAARHDPDASCEAYFSPEEWQPAYLVHNDGGDLPSEPITISEFMLIIAELGGWQRKKSQGPPGSTTIWRGLRRSEAYADAFKAFKKANSRCGG
jgi:IS4 transposase